MSALGRFFARLFGRPPEPRRSPMSFAPDEAAPEVDPRFSAEAELPDAPPPPPAEPTQEPRSELAFTPALGAASGEAQVLAAQAGVELVGEDAPTAEDEEDVFEEEERAEDGADEEGGARLDLDDKIAMREAAVPYLRSVAEEEALSGEHRVRPTDPSGPGTLAEALTRLEAQGRVECVLGEDEAGAPVLVYRPRA